MLRRSVEVATLTGHSRIGDTVACSFKDHNVTTIPDADLSRYLKVAIDAAEGAGRIINDMRSSAGVHEKPDGSIVTEADTAAEVYLRDVFAKHTPEITVWGEEFGRADNRSEIEWIVDPIDGTTWYEMGSPIFGTLIGLAIAGQPVIGVIAMPATQEMVFAASGQGCFYSHPRSTRPELIRVRESVENLKDARVSSSGLHRTDIWREAGHTAYALSRLPKASKLFRLAGDCVQHALVSRGKLDGAIDTEMYPWDSAAIIPCVEEAGGCVSGIDGQTGGVLECGSLVSASSRQLLNEMVAILQP